MKKVKVVYIFFWFLLIYIVLALVWWFIALNEQNTTITSLYLQLHLSSINTNNILLHGERKKYQYIGEGIIFLIFILAVAWLLYNYLKKQIIFSQQQENFMMAITHEFNTPLSIIKLNTETLQYRKLNEEQYQRLITQMQIEVNRLEELITNVLFSTQDPLHNKQQQSLEMLDMYIVLQELVQLYTYRFPTRIFRCEATHNLLCQVHPFQINLLLRNLLDNAVKYSTGAITISGTKDDHRIAISIADEGPGITDEEKKRIFKRFYRIGKEQVRHANGTGLGLYICDMIARYHHTKINVLDRSPQGSIFLIYFQLHHI